MVNSILIFLSSYNKNKKVSYSFMGLWLLYLLLTTKFEYGIIYPLVSAALFLITAIVINTFVKNRIANCTLSVCSVLLWSMLIDTACYFIFPEYDMGLSLINYVFNGIIYNAKYIVLNVVVLAVVLGFEILYKKFVQDKIVRKEINK